MNKVNLEFYVLNHNFNKRKVEMFNIFWNYHVYEYAIKYTEDYLDGKISYGELKEELRKTIMWQEWSRCEYEISVGDAFEEDVNKLEKTKFNFQTFATFNQIIYSFKNIINSIINN